MYSKDDTGIFKQDNKIGTVMYQGTQFVAIEFINDQARTDFLQSYSGLDVEEPINTANQRLIAMVVWDGITNR